MIKNEENCVNLQGQNNYTLEDLEKESRSIEYSFNISYADKY